MIGSPRCSARSPSSSTPASASSRSSASCGPSASSGSASAANATGSTDHKALPVPLRRPGQQPRPHRGPAGEQRAAHRPRDARRDPVEVGPGRSIQLPAWNEALGLHGRGISSGHCGCNRCSPTRRTSWSTTTSSTARPSSRQRTCELCDGAWAELDEVLAMGGRSTPSRRSSRGSWRRWPNEPGASRPASRWSSASTASPRPSRRRSAAPGRSSVSTRTSRPRRSPPCADGAGARRRAVDAALADLRERADSDENVMPATIALARRRDHGRVGRRDARRLRRVPPGRPASPVGRPTPWRPHHRRRMAAIAARRPARACSSPSPDSTVTPTAPSRSPWRHATPGWR